MSDPARDNQPSRRASRMRVVALLACLAGVLAFLLLSSGGGNGPSRSRTESSAACAGGGTPAVSSVAPEELGALRESVAGVLPERVGRLYEEGTVSGSNLWSDEPPSGPAVSTTARREGGYEMRWWAPNGDDVVADVLLFANADQASDFLQRVSERRCGAALLRGAANRPPQGRNLAWVNPDGVAETDVLLARGRRVFRVGDVPPGQQQHHLSAARLRGSLYTVDTLACLLPAAHCESESNSVPA